MSVTNLFSLIALVMCGFAAVTDTRHGLIPNWLTFPVILGAPLVHAWTSGPEALLGSFLSLLACGAVPYLLFRRGAMGGGDVKLFAALGALGGARFGLQVEVSALALACVWSFGVLAYRGALFAMLRRCLRLSLGRWLPASYAAADTLAMTYVRLGAPIAIAALGNVCLEQTSWFSVLP